MSGLPGTDDALPTMPRLPNRRLNSREEIELRRFLGQPKLIAEEDRRREEFEENIQQMKWAFYRQERRLSHDLTSTFSNLLKAGTLQSHHYCLSDVQ